MNATRAAPRTSWLGILVLIACAVLWSLAGPLIKLLVEAGVPGVTIACYRSLFGGAVFLPLALRHLGTLRCVSLRWRISTVAVFTLMTVCFVISTTQTAAANAIILQYTAPVWVFLFAPLLLHERFRMSDGLVLLLAMAGVAIIFFGHATGDVPALLVALASGLGFGLVIVTLRGLSRAEPSAVVAMNFLGSGLLLLPAVAIWGSFRIAGLQQFGLILALGVVQMAVPYLMFSWALKHVEAPRASLIVLLETVFNPVLTFLIVGEVVPAATLVGGPLILVSVVGWMLLTWRREVRLIPPGG